MILAIAAMDFAKGQYKVTCFAPGVSPSLTEEMSSILDEPSIYKYSKSENTFKLSFLNYFSNHSNTWLIHGIHISFVHCEM